MSVPLSLENVSDWCQCNYGFRHWILNPYNWAQTHLNKSKWEPLKSTQFCQWEIGLLILFFFPFIFISWSLITLQYCGVFVIHWHESAMDLHVFPIPIPPPTFLSTWSLWVFPVHQARALVSCIQPGLVICFTLDNIHVSMLLSRNIPPSPSPTESKILFCTSVSLFLFCI